MLESIKSNRNGMLYNKVYLNLRSKFFLVFFLLVIVPFLILGFVAYQRSKAAVEHNYSSLSASNIRQTSLIIDTYLDDIKHFADALSKNPVLLKALVKEIAVNKDAEKNLNINFKSPITSIYGEMNSKLESIFFITAQHTYNLYAKTSNNSLPEESSFSDYTYRTAVNKPEVCNLIGTNLRFYKGGAYSYVISVSKAVKSPETGEILGVYLMDFSYDSLAGLLRVQKSKEFKGSQLYITDNGNNVMYSTDKGLLTLKLNYSFTKEQISPDKAKTVYKDKKRMRISSYKLPLSSWKAYELIPSANVTRSILAINAPFLIFMFICLIILLIFPVVLLSMFFKPLSKLSIAISGKENNDFSPENHHAKNTDAKGNDADNNSTPNFDGLINKVYYSRLKQKEVQLVALQNQINPHFLYNTLESIRGAALHHGIQSIASMAKNLSSFFRYSIGEEVLVPIKDEIKHLENYIAIQNFRHDDKFELVYKLPEELYDYKLLKLTLQPLVENSIKHGLEMKIGKGKIKIDILLMDSIIKIRIFDDGIGMPQDKIVELNRTLEDDIPIHTAGNVSSGVGVRNVNSRIKLYFGEQYGIRYLGLTEGTTVEVTFPAVK